MTADIATCETCLLEFVQTCDGGQECERCIAAGKSVYTLKTYNLDEYLRMMELPL